MYSHRESDGLVIILYTEDFTLDLWWYDDDIKGEIKSSVVIIDYNGKKIIRTSVIARAFSHWNSCPVTSILIHVPYHLFYEIEDMLSGYGCYYIPHSKQTRIMRLLEAVLY